MARWSQNLSRYQPNGEWDIVCYLKFAFDCEQGIFLSLSRIASPTISFQAIYHTIYLNRTTYLYVDRWVSARMGIEPGPLVFRSECTDVDTYYSPNCHWRDQYRIIQFKDLRKISLRQVNDNHGVTYKKNSLFIMTAELALQNVVLSVPGIKKRPRRAIKRHEMWTLGWHISLD